MLWTININAQFESEIVDETDLLEDRISIRFISARARSFNLSLCDRCKFTVATVEGDESRLNEIVKSIDTRKIGNLQMLQKLQRDIRLERKELVAKLLHWQIFGNVKEHGCAINLKQLLIQILLICVHKVLLIPIVPSNKIRGNIALIFTIAHIIVGTRNTIRLISMITSVTVLHPQRFVNSARNRFLVGR